MNPSNGNKPHKGWLSRWTRKQWSRHWFVLKSGSLTYYRGPAAELCSFLDGVLDLSLIKHIEVQRAPGGSEKQQEQDSRPGAGGRPAKQAVAEGAGQFAFSLKMWNGECHLLAAESCDERQLWLQAISACSSGDSSPSSALDDDPATDSSSDSSPTSNLSGLDHFGLGGLRRPLLEQQVSLDQLAASIRSSLARSRAAAAAVATTNDVQLELERPSSPAAPRRLQAAPAERHLAAPAPTERPLAATCESSQQSAGEQQFVSSSCKQEQESQAFKRRLLCLQASRHAGSGAGEPQLVARRSAGPAHQPMSSSPSESSASGDEEDEEKHQQEEVPQLRDLEQREAGPAAGGREEKLKKRVTFDLTSLRQTRHHHSQQRPPSADESSADEDEGAARCEDETSDDQDDQEEQEEPEGDEDDDCSLSCSSVGSSSSSCSSADEQELPLGAGEHRPPPVDVRMQVDCESRLAATSCDREPPLASPRGGATEAGCQTEPEAGRLELERRLEGAQASVGRLEGKLGDSYASYSLLEQSYQRLQARLSQCDLTYKDELGRLEARVAELERELVDNEQRLAESRLQLLQLEQLAASGAPASRVGPSSNQQLQRAAVNKALSNWLRVTGQQVSGGHGLLQAKHAAVASQQALGLKLLSQSRQIQRKLNQLELKVDKIDGKQRQLAAN